MDYSIKEVSVQLNVSEGSIRNYIKNNLLKAHKKRKGLRIVYFIREADLDIFLRKFWN